MNDQHYDRNIRFFGVEGQNKLRSVAVAVIGIGGIGTHIVQQLSLLGVGTLYLIDPEEIDESNRNRYIGVRWDDPIPGTSKVSIGKRIATSIRRDITVEVVEDTFISDAGYAAIKEADYVFGSLDKEGPRLVLLEVSAVLQKPYIDVATEIVPGNPHEYGGRVCFSFFGQGCLSCRDLLDRDEAGRQLAGEVERENRHAIYGVPTSLLDGSGPSVAPINGVAACLAANEFMLHVTGQRSAKPHLNYNARLGPVTVGRDHPHSECYYCQGLFTGNQTADIEQYFKHSITKAIA